MSNCERLREAADRRDAEARSARIAALPALLREAAFTQRSDNAVVFQAWEVRDWLCDGMYRTPSAHPCFDVLHRFNNRRVDDETLAMLRAEFDKIIEWCMTAPTAGKPWWRRFLP